MTYRAVRRLGANDLGYTDPAGLAELRGNICEYLRAARAVRCDPEQVIITGGTQQAIDMAIRVLLAPGDEVWVEDPGYPLTHAQLLLAKMRPHPIPVDSQGLIVDAGQRSAPRARAAFVTPSHQFPTGVMLSMARRLELLGNLQLSFGSYSDWFVPRESSGNREHSEQPGAEKVCHCSRLHRCKLLATLSALCRSER